MCTRHARVYLTLSHEAVRLRGAQSCSRSLSFSIQAQLLFPSGVTHTHAGRHHDCGPPPYFTTYITREGCMNVPRRL